MVDSPVSGAFASEPPSLERYHCVERLSAGGMGLVWRAHDRQLHRDVALKTVPIGASEDVLARHVQEGRIAAQLDVEGVVRVFDQGTLADGRPFLVMELVETPALGHGLDRDLEVLAEVAAAVGEAHRLGFVHRDLKPSNIGLRGRRAVVLDWGLAKPIEADSVWSRRVLTGASPVTHTGVTLGSLGYMAPEQIAGDVVSARTDVWALGAMLHQVLTGRAPYEGGGHRLLSDVGARRLQLPAHPAADAVRRALSLDPQQRYPDGAALAEALRQVTLPRSQAGRRVFASVGGVFLGALALFLLGARLVPSTSEDPTALVEAGALLAENGRLAEARERGSRAEALQSTPRGRGLLLLPPAIPAQQAPTSCTTLLRTPGQATNVCLEPDTMTLYQGDERRWDRLAPDRAWVFDNTVVVHENWELLGLDTASGAVRWSTPDRSVGDVVLVGDLLLRSYGPVTMVHRLVDGELQKVLSLPLEATLGAPVGPRASLFASGHLYAVDAEGAHRLAEFDEPLVASFMAGARTVFVGLRGRVVHLDPDGAVRVDLRLRHASQVHDAAPLPGGGLAVVTRRGLFVYRGSQVEHQLSTDSDLRLTIDGAGVLEAHAGGRTLRWPALAPEQRHLLTPREQSTTAFGGRDPALASGTAVVLYDPVSLDHQERLSVPSPPLRSVLTPDFVGSNTEGFAIDGQRLEPIGDLPLLVPLASGTVVGARRHDAGVAWIRDGETTWQSDLKLRSLVGEHGGRRALGVDELGALWAVDEHTTTRLGPLGVDVVASGGLGTALARGSTVELLDGFEVDTGQRVSTLAVSDALVVAGTFAGELFVFDRSGAHLARVPAHRERVSALIFHGRHLFSGSWEPGVRRWPLGTLVSP